MGKNGVTVRSNLSRIAALLAASLACCALQARAESMDALYETAKLEKTVVLYGGDPTAEALRVTSVDPSRDLYPAARNERYAARAITAEERATTYNNFYEFGASKNVVAASMVRPAL